MENNDKNPRWIVVPNTANVRIEVIASSNVKAREGAVKEFRRKHNIKLPVSQMICDWHAFKMPEIHPETETEELLVAF